MKRIGLIVNPVAGMGGRVGLKGTDGEETLRTAIRLGAKPQSSDRAAEALQKLVPLQDSFKLLACPGSMGEEAAITAGLPCRLLTTQAPAQTSAADTIRACTALAEAGTDLLLFAGGDGTARDICSAAADIPAALGIPAGVKIHSAVFACSPTHAGDIAASFVKGEIKRTRESEVMDIDEEAFRRGALSAKLYGYLRIPAERQHVQRLKAGSSGSDAVAQQAIAQEIVERMEDGGMWVIGPGSTTGAVMERLRLQNTLLGVDLVTEGKSLPTM